MGREIKEDVEGMSNLGQAIREDGRKEGIKEGKRIEETRFIMNMYRKGYSIDKIADITEKSTDEVQAIIDAKGPMLGWLLRD